MRISIVSFLIMVSSSVFAQDFAKGAAAYAEQEFAKGAAAFAERDHQAALRAWKPLAIAGNAKAQFAVATICRLNRGELRSFKIAAKWYHLAAKQGQSISQSFLAYLYAKGLGVLQNYKLAYMWYNIAVTNGSPTADSNRAEIMNKLTPEAVLKAQDMALECMTSGYENCGYIEQE